jgi:hypothetical protein
MDMPPRAIDLAALPIMDARDLMSEEARRRYPQCIHYSAGAWPGS